jgi:AraC family transcriptional regulator, regulatory protein of adaptative response / methylated-DNA-[protein]-cysteine methyltransferase
MEQAKDTVAVEQTRSGRGGTRRQAMRRQEVSMTQDRLWDAVLSRDSRFDGHFVYAVTSTGVFCRPSCPSRRPRRHNVRFFERPQAAEQAGFRACRRCQPTSAGAVPTATAAIRRASRYLAAHADETVSLAILARVARLSPFHLQRQFKRALGLSPREYQAACRAARFRKELRSGRGVTDAMYESGYGSPSRLYEARPTGRGMPPAVYRRGGAGSDIGFATVVTPLGCLLVAATAKGVCAVTLGDTLPEVERALRNEFPSAEISADRHVRAEWIEAVVHRLTGDADSRELPLDIRGTAFQWKVWRALQEIPRGERRSYSDIARAIGHPTAARAVARACATNPACLIVPCHRAVPKGGGVGGYRWGPQRKRRLLESEDG